MIVLNPELFLRQRKKATLHKVAFLRCLSFWRSGRLFLGKEVELFIAAELDLEREGAEARAFEEENGHRLATAPHAFAAEGIGILTG